MSTTMDHTSAVDLARTALARFGLPPDTRIEFVKYRENWVYRLRCGDGRSFAMRIHRPGYRSDAAIRTELNHLAALHERGLLVPEVLPALDGDTMCALVDEDGQRFQIDVQRWVDGTEPLGAISEAFDGSSDLQPDTFRRLGELAATMHTCTQNIGASTGFARDAWDLDGLIGTTPLWGDPRALAELSTSDTGILARGIAALRHDLDEYGVHPGNFGLIHADFTPENILTRGDDLVVIDFDDFGAGWYLFDLATIVFFYLPHPRYGEYRRAMLDGYRAIRPLTDDDLQMWDAMLVARGLTYLGWAGQRRGDDTAEFIVAELAPLVVDLVAVYLDKRDDRTRSPHTPAAPADSLLERRSATLGPHAMLFYTSPLHVVSGNGVWLRDVDGEDYLDAYNNVPHVGHCHPRVVDAVHTQLGRLNIHTRYLNERIVDYAESLLATFEPGLDRVFFTNSGSESNELALRIARQHTGNTGLIVSDFSYHGNTIALAELTTGLTVKEPLGRHVRAVRVPDLAGPLTEAARADELDKALAEVEKAIASLTATGHGVSAALFDPLFSTEGLPWVPREYIQGVARLVRAAGGLVIADEVQSGFGRVGSSMWGYQMYDVTPDLVTLGKPMGNGHPVGAVITTAPLSDEFGANNLYFNTFAGNPVSAAAATAVLDIIEDEQLLANARAVGEYVRGLLQTLVDRHDFLVGVRGRGLFFGLEVGTSPTDPRPDLAKEIVERMRTKKVLISKVGRDDSVLKMRPPLVFSTAHADLLVERLTECLGEIGG